MHRSGILEYVDISIDFGLNHINTIVFERFFRSFNAIPDKQQSGLGLKFNNSLCVRDAAYDLIMLVSFSSAYEKLNDKGLDILSP